MLSPFFLARGRHWQEDLPELASQASEAAGVDYRLAEPLGTHEYLADILLERAADSLKRPS